MTEPAEYKYYSARLKRELFGYFPRLLWGKWVSRDDGREYTRKWVLRIYGDKWPDVLQDARWSENYLIEGRVDKSAEWELLSRWAISEERRRDLILARWYAEEAELRVERRRPGRPSGLGIGVLVRHLRDIEGLTNYDELLLALRESGLQSVIDAVAGWGEDARSKLPKLYAENGKRHEAHCPYCESRVSPAIKAATD